MARKQTRRSVSLNKSAFDAGKIEAERRGMTFAGLVEFALAEIGVTFDPHPQQTPDLVQKSIAARRPSRERQLLGDGTADRVTAAVMREISDAGPIERSRSFLPMSSDVPIPAGKTVQVLGRPQLPFRGDRLAIWSGCASSFFIEGVKVGNQHQGVQAGTIPADAFATRLDLLPLLDTKLQKEGFVEVRISKKAEECFGQPIAMPLAQVSTDIMLVVTNVSKEPMRFVGVILGDQEWR